MSRRDTPLWNRSILNREMAQICIEKDLIRHYEMFSCITLNDITLFPAPAIQHGEFKSKGWQRKKRGATGHRRRPLTDGHAVLQAGHHPAVRGQLLPRHRLCRGGREGSPALDRRHGRQADG